MRTLTLPEYQQRLDVQLDDEDLKALAPFRPQQLVITPSLAGSGYDLGASSWVGAIKTPGVALVLEPKVTITRLLFLLSYALDPKRWRDIPFDYRPTDSLVEAIIPGFVHRRAIRQGVHRLPEPSRCAQHRAGTHRLRSATAATAWPDNNAGGRV
jgi:5-methylcytosine-specific restriction enzyme subunit McrC